MDIDANDLIKNLVEQRNAAMDAAAAANAGIAKLEREIKALNEAIKKQENPENG